MVTTKAPHAPTTTTQGEASSGRKGGLFFKRAVHWSLYLYRVIATEISAATRYYDRVVQLDPLPHDSGYLLETITCPQKQVVADVDEMPDLSGERDRRTAVLMNGNFNYPTDIHGLLADLKPKLSRTTRLKVVAYNPYFRWLYRLADLIGLRKCEPPSTFLTRADLLPMARLTGYEVVRIRPCGYAPFRWFGIGSAINWIMPAIPLARWLGLVSVVTLQPKIAASERPSLSILIPARNERGNIENALKRMPDLGAKLEILFVEGHSQDGTWEEIQRVQAEWSDRYDIKSFQQTGKGKNDAVRLGFQNATGDLLTILDADLTMPPEMLGRFYEAWVQGEADFINGSRLVYPMEGEAMRFLNRLGNIFFAKALSFVLGTRLGDSLCGTKLVARHDYKRIVRWRDDFGDFDPFGDFELLFPASILSLGVIDIPIRYRARTYGSTQISRFRHGFQLLRMTTIGLLRVRTGRV